MDRWYFSVKQMAYVVTENGSYIYYADHLEAIKELKTEIIDLKLERKTREDNAFYHAIQMSELPKHDAEVLRKMLQEIEHAWRPADLPLGIRAYADNLENIQ